MTRIWVIFKKELSSYFNAPIAYIVICLFLVIVGFLFFSTFFLINKLSMRDFFMLVPVTYLFFAPAITMKLIAEEKRTGTFEVLVTMPVRDSEVILGKYLAAVALLAITLLMTVPFALTVSLFGDIDMGPVIGGYIGLFLLGACYLAIGFMASSFTEHQIIAFFIAGFIAFVFFLLDRILILLPESLASILEYVSFDYHYNGIARGVIDTRNIIYFLSFITVCLLISYRTLESRRWK